MIGSLTVLPALLSKLGDRVEKGRIPFLGRLPPRRRREPRLVEGPHPGAPPSGRSRRSLAPPCSLAMAVPVLHLHTAQSGLDALPRERCRRSRRSTASRPRSSARRQPAVVAVTTPSRPTPPTFKNADQRVPRPRRSRPGELHGPGQLDVDQSHTRRADRRSRSPATASTRRRTQALAELRGTTSSRRPSARCRARDWAVTGDTAASHDYNAMMKRSAPSSSASCCSSRSCSCSSSFRSIVIAAKAVVLNLLSVGAAYGVVIATFQWGWGENLLNFKSNGGIASWLPIFMFVILFGLSMDYHVFILSRIREAFDRGISTEDAVEHGIKTTAGTVSSAALVMVGAFGDLRDAPVPRLQGDGHRPRGRSAHRRDDRPRRCCCRRR